MADILEKAVEATPKDNMESNQELKDLFDGLTMTGSQLLKGIDESYFAGQTSNRPANR